MNESIDPIATQQAWEQGTAALMNLAKAMGDYYRELRAAGMDKREAFTLVQDYQRIMLTSGRG